MTETAATRHRWSVEMFAAFWDDPDPSLVVFDTVAFEKTAGVPVPWT